MAHGNIDVSKRHAATGRICTNVAERPAFSLKTSGIRRGTLGTRHAVFAGVMNNEDRANQRLRQPEPKREEKTARPAVETLGGVSKYEAESAGSVRRALRKPPEPKHRREPLSARPEELGRRFLERATQTQRSSARGTPPEQIELREGEENMLDAVEGEVETEDRLVTRLTLPTD